MMTTDCNNNMMMMHSTRRRATLLITITMVSSFLMNGVSGTIITIPVEADATIREDTPRINYGTSDAIEFITPPSDTYNDGTRIEGILRFDMSSLLSSTSPSDGGDDGEMVIKKAVLKLFTNDKCNLSKEALLSYTGDIGNMQTAHVQSSSNWGAETDVTWESFAYTNAEDLHSNDDELVQTPLETFTANNWIDIDVTTFLRSDIMSTKKFFSLKISSSLESHGANDNIALCHFYSSNWSHGQLSPQLYVDYSTPSSSSSTSTSGSAANSAGGSSYNPLNHKPSSSSENTAAVVVTTANCATPYKDFRAGYQFVSGEVVSAEGKNFECKEWPMTPWCSNSDYAPGGSRNWGLAWKLMDECKTLQQSIHSKGQEDTDTYEKPKPIHVKPIVNNLAPDEDGSSSISSSGSGLVNVATINTSQGCPPVWRLNRVYAEGDGVTSLDTLLIYSCREYPFTARCGLSPYEVERGPVFEDAWKEVGQCVNGKMVLYKDAGDVEAEYSKTTTTTTSTTTSTTTTTTTTRLTPRPSPRATTRPLTPQPTPRPTIFTLYSPVTIIHAVTEGGVSTPTAMQVEESWMASSFVEAGFSSIKEEQPSAFTTTEEEVGGDTTTQLSDTVCIGGRLYVCTDARYCHEENFEPKGGEYWTLVWEHVGACGETNVEEVDTAPTIPSPSLPACPDERWAVGHTYEAGDKVTVSKQSYVCKDEPATSWCGMTGYQPGVDQYWNMAWDLEGDCSDDGAGSSSSMTVASPPPRPTLPPPRPFSTPPPVYSPTGIISQPTTEASSITARPTPRPTPRPTMKPVSPPPTSKPTPKPVTPPPTLRTRRPTPRPSRNPVTPPPTRKPTSKPVVSPPPTSPPTSQATSSNVSDGIAASTTQKVYDILDQKEKRINSELFLYATGTGTLIPSEVYRYRGFKDGLEVMHEDGAGGSHFYLGDASDIGYKIGLTNIAAFLAQSMKETIKYDACDENSWDLVNNQYPLSNACGQLGQSYQDYQCPDHERHMECELDPTMEIVAATNAKWYGAPGPLFCGPKSKYEYTGHWDYTIECNHPWKSPPEYCSDYEGQKAGGYVNSYPVENSSGRTDVENCCWWGRGVIQTTGRCNFGKLNYYLGAKAAQEGRPSRYPTIDFCKDPEVICNSEANKELKWVAGLFYWINSLQTYSEGGWDYTTELHKFVEGGMVGDSFINAVSGVVNRGCHNPPCGTGPVDGAQERAANFRKVLSVLID